MRFTLLQAGTCKSRAGQFKAVLQHKQYAGLFVQTELTRTKFVGRHPGKHAKKEKQRCHSN